MSHNETEQLGPGFAFGGLAGSARRDSDPLAVLCLEEADSLRPAYSSFIGGLRQGLARRLRLRQTLRVGAGLLRPCPPARPPQSWSSLQS